MWSVECKVWSVKCRVWSGECGLWSVKCRVYSVECKVWSVKCKGWSVECKSIAPATQNDFGHVITQVGMSQSAAPATQNVTTCLETFEKERFCSFPHRHDEATGKPETRDETRRVGASKRAFRARLPPRKLQRIFWKRRKSIGPATQNDFRHLTKHVGMSRSATHATRNEATRHVQPPQVSKSDPFCRTYHRHGHTGLARTVANGCEHKRNVEGTHPQPPDPRSETGTLATHSGKNQMDCWDLVTCSKSDPQLRKFIQAQPESPTTSDWSAERAKHVDRGEQERKSKFPISWDEKWNGMEWNIICTIYTNIYIYIYYIHIIYYIYYVLNIYIYIQLFIFMIHGVDWDVLSGIFMI